MNQLKPPKLRSPNERKNRKFLSLKYVCAGGYPIQNDTAFVLSRSCFFLCMT